MKQNEKPNKPVQPGRSPGGPTSKPNARLLAWIILQQWEPRSWFAEDRIDHDATRHHLNSPDRGLLSAIVLAVLRNKMLLDAWIDHLRGGGRLNPPTRELLRMGLAQFLLLGMPSHASVNETVNLAPQAGRGLINAILRRAVREAEELRKFAETLPWNISHSLPEFLATKWRNNFGANQALAMAAWINQPAPITVRVNELKFRAEAKLKDFPGSEKLPNHIGFYRCQDLPTRLLQDGVVYAQDPSTAMAPRLLAPVPGENILDACAAPGGKTALMAELMENQGRIIAADSIPKRIQRLQGNLQRLGVKNAETLQLDWLQDPIPAWLEDQDAILLDVPCSNTGVMRRRVDVRWRLEENSATEMQALQLRLLEKVAPLARKGGRVVYSTCSIEAEENDGVVQKFLTAHPEFTLKEASRTLPFRDAIDGSYAALLIRKH